MVDTGIFCSGAHIVRKAGYGVSSTISGAEAFTNDFISQAESYINASTRYNWSDNYASLNADLKEVLKEAASNIAAAYMINYHMGGYTSRVEAQTMINYLWARAEKCLDILKDEQTKKFIREV